MKFLYLFILIVFAFIIYSPTGYFSKNVGTTSQNAKNAVLRPPNYRRLFHGVHPGSPDGDESKVDDLPLYQSAVSVVNPDGSRIPRKAAFVYLSQELDENWLRGADSDGNSVPVFPESQIRTIYQNGSIPFVRLMIRTTMDTNDGNENKEKLYTYEVLLDEEDSSLKNESERRKNREARQNFRNRIIRWGEKAAQLTQEFNKPIYIEWGTEVNGKWFWWNAYWHNKKWCANTNPTNLERCYEGGVRKFRQSFLRIRQLVNHNAHGADFRWVFHVASESDPNPLETTNQNIWNALDKYYPGKDCPECVNAVGVSIYGSQEKNDTCKSFENQMDRLFPTSSQSGFDTLKEIGKTKDVFVLEIGTNFLNENSNNPNSTCYARDWTSRALEKLFDANYLPDYRIAGFSWWNEAWKGKDGLVDMRLQKEAVCNRRLNRSNCAQLTTVRESVRQRFVNIFTERDDFILGQLP